MKLKNNPFENSHDNKRYYTWNHYLKTTFHSKVCKVALNAQFTCPNRDGTIAYHGCLFCGESGAGEQIQAFFEPLEIQYEKNKNRMLKKWPNAKTIAYFQAYTNTYCSLHTLQATIEPFYIRDDVVALSLATRADCLEDDKITYLAKLAKQKEIWIELGLQSIHDNSAKAMHRGHDFACFLDCIKRLQHTNLKICVHLMNSLPNETQKMMIASLKRIVQLPIHALKLHMLYIDKHSALGKQYMQKKFSLLSFDEYVDTVIKQLEYTPKHIIIQRLTGDGDKCTLLAPLWSLNKTAILNAIDKEMVKRNTYQGKKVANE
ncbi:MAG: TIGR01212 family radical SAM protein [Breznakia sp.]